jgi:hypothetical protein
MHKASTLLIIAAALLVAAGAASAGETCTVRISCTIPSIPGVNAPLEEATTYADSTQAASVQPGNEINKEYPDTQDDGSKKENKDDAGKVEDTETTQLALVKTFYSK